MKLPSPHTDPIFFDRPETQPSVHHSRPLNLQQDHGKLMSITRIHASVTDHRNHSTTRTSIETKPASLILSLLSPPNHPSTWLPLNHALWLWVSQKFSIKFFWNFKNTNFKRKMSIKKSKKKYSNFFSKTYFEKISSKIQDFSEFFSSADKMTGELFSHFYDHSCLS